MDTRLPTAPTTTSALWVRILKFLCFMLNSAKISLSGVFMVHITKVAVGAVGYRFLMGV
jgi:hypothetical protein